MALLNPVMERASEAVLAPARPALLLTKLYPPRVRSELVDRPRLLDALDRGADCKLTLISTPPGYGKSTLVVQWLSRADRPAAWLSLDEGDNDSRTFFTYLVAAIQAIDPTLTSATSALLDTRSVVPTHAILNALLNELAAATRPFVLVLDDIHAIDAPEILDGIAFLLQQLPPMLRVVITGRGDPPLPLVRMRARGELHGVARGGFAVHRRGDAGTAARAAQARPDVDRARGAGRENRGLGGRPPPRRPRRPRSAPRACAADRHRAHRQRSSGRRLSLGGGDPAAVAGGAVVPAADGDLRPLQRRPVRRRHRHRGQRRGDAGVGAVEPVPGPAGRSRPLVPLPPLLRRRAPRSPLAGGDGGRDLRPAPARRRLVRGARPPRRGDPARGRGARLGPGGAPLAPALRRAPQPGPRDGGALLAARAAGRGHRAGSEAVLLARLVADETRRIRRGDAAAAGGRAGLDRNRRPPRARRGLAFAHLAGLVEPEHAPGDRRTPTAPLPSCRRIASPTARSRS